MARSHVNTKVGILLVKVLPLLTTVAIKILQLLLMGLNYRSSINGSTNPCTHIQNLKLQN